MSSREAEVRAKFAEVVAAWARSDSSRYETWGRGRVSATDAGGTVRVAVTFDASDGAAGTRAASDEKGWAALEVACGAILSVSVAPVVGRESPVAVVIHGGICAATSNPSDISTAVGPYAGELVSRLLAGEQIVPGPELVTELVDALTCVARENVRWSARVKKLEARIDAARRTLDGGP